MNHQLRYHQLRYPTKRPRSRIQSEHYSIPYHQPSLRLARMLDNSNVSTSKASGTSVGFELKLFVLLRPNTVTRAQDATFCVDIVGLADILSPGRPSRPWSSTQRKLQAICGLYSNLAHSMRRDTTQSWRLSRAD